MSQLTPDQLHDLRNSLFKDLHSSPSPDTKDFMKETRDNFKQVADSLKSLEIHIIEIKSDLKITKEQTLKTNGRVNKLDEYKPMLNDISREREVKEEIKVDLKKDFYKRIFDISWKVIIFALLALANLDNLKSLF